LHEGDISNNICYLHTGSRPRARVDELPDAKFEQESFHHYHQHIQSYDMSWSDSEPDE